MLARECAQDITQHESAAAISADRSRSMGRGIFTGRRLARYRRSKMILICWNRLNLRRNWRKRLDVLGIIGRRYRTGGSLMMASHHTCLDILREVTPASEASTLQRAPEILVSRALAASAVARAQPAGSHISPWITLY